MKKSLLTSLLIGLCITLLTSLYQNKVKLNDSCNAEGICLAVPQYINNSKYYGFPAAYLVKEDNRVTEIRPKQFAFDATLWTILAIPFVLVVRGVRKRGKE